MIGNDDDGDIYAYRPWTWIAGYLAAVALGTLMVRLSTGFL